MKSKKKMGICLVVVTLVVMAIDLAVDYLLPLLFPALAEAYFLKALIFTLLFLPVLYFCSRYQIKRQDQAVTEVAQDKEAENTALTREVGEHEERYRVLVENLPVGFLTCDREGKITMVNMAVSQIMGSPSLEATRQINVFNFEPLVKSGIVGSLKNCLETGQSYQTQATYTSKWGKKLYLHMHLAPLRDLGGEITGVQGIVEDFTEYKEARDKLQTYFQVIEHSPVAVLISDDEETVTYVNDRYIELTGYSREEVLGKSTRAFYQQDEASRIYYREMVNTVRDRKVWKREFYNRKKNGQGYWENISVSPVFNEDGNIYHYVVLKEDITDRKEKAQRAEFLAYHDALTGLANRGLFSERLTVAVNDAREKQNRVAVMYMDLDGFKEINDSYGHDTGDQLLKAIAAELKNIVRKGDTVARMGGDEFTLIIPGIQEFVEAQGIAQKILETVKKPWTPQKLSITASIGIAFYPLNGTTAEELLKNSDRAMYQAKNRGKNNYQLYSESN